MDDDKSAIGGGGGVVIAEKCNDDRHYRESWDASDRQPSRKTVREAKKDKAAACASGNVTDSGKNSGGGKTQDDSCGEGEGRGPSLV